MKYNSPTHFVEYPSFTRLRPTYLTDDEYAALCRHIASNPTAGDVIPGAGGFRKIRWANSRKGKGKRGGSRTIYLLTTLDAKCHLLDIYDHGEKDDLSRKEIAGLADLAHLLKEQAKASRPKPTPPTHEQKGKKK